MPPPDPEAFIARWSLADAREPSTSQSFLNDLIALIDADRRARATAVAPLLETLAALGHARPTEGGRYAP